MAPALTALASAARSASTGGSLAEVSENTDAALKLNRTVVNSYVSPSTYPYLLEGTQNSPGDASVTALADSSHMVWDAATKRLVFIEGAYGAQSQPSSNTLVWYDEAANSWSCRRKPQSADRFMSHLFSLNTADYARRRLYRAYYEFANGYGVDEFNLDSSTLAFTQNISVSWGGGQRQVNGFAFMPSFGAQGSFIGLYVGDVIRHDLESGTSSASVFAANAYTVGNPQFCVAHHSTGDVVFGGGNDTYNSAAEQKAWYRIAANGSALARLDDSDVAGGPGSCNMAEGSTYANRALMCAHPTEDAMVIFHSGGANGGVHKLSFNAASGSQWSRLGDLPAALYSNAGAARLSYTVAAAIPAHGVVGIVQWRASGQSKFWAYRP